MGDFDQILKQNIEAILLPLSKKYLGISIKTMVRLKEKLPLTDREVDFIAKVTDDVGAEFLVHIEFQTTDDKQMVYRMAEYHAIWLRKYKLPIRHFVIYLGKQKPKSRTKLDTLEQFTGYQLINLHEIDPESLLQSDVPQEVIMAILCHIGENQSQEIIRRIIQRLQELSNRPQKLKKYISHLTILSRLCNFETLTIQITKEMPITYNIEKDGLYLQGLKKGELKGELKGMKEGKIEGKIEGKSESEMQNLRNLIKYNPKLTDNELAQMTGLTVQKVFQHRSGFSS